MMLLFKLEFYKLRHRRLWLVVPALLAVELGWSLWAMGSYINRHGAAEMWGYVLNQFATLNCILLPLFIAVLASRACDLEHKGESFKLLETLVSPQAIYLAKFLALSVYVLAMALAQLVCFGVLNGLLGFEDRVPTVYVGQYLLVTVVVSLMLLAFQQGLSLLWRNQMIALTAGLGGTFLGLMALFFPPVIQQLTPWAYYGRLSPVLMVYDADLQTAEFFFVGVDWPFLLWSVLLGSGFLAVGCLLFSRQEV